MERAAPQQVHPPGASPIPRGHLPETSQSIAACRRKAASGPDVRSGNAHLGRGAVSSPRSAGTPASYAAPSCPGPVHIYASFPLVLRCAGEPCPRRLFSSSQEQLMCHRSRNSRSPFIFGVLHSNHHRPPSYPPGAGYEKILRILKFPQIGKAGRPRAPHTRESRPTAIWRRFALKVDCGTDLGVRRGRDKAPLREVEGTASGAYR